MHQRHFAHLEVHHRRLSLASGATLEDVKQAYRAKALSCHPDVVPHEQKLQAEVEFRAVSESYVILMKNIAAVDQTRGIPPQSNNPPQKPPAWSQGFVRKQAEKVFREAFDGRSAEDIIFEAKLKARQHGGSFAEDSQFSAQQQRDAKWKEEVRRCEHRRLHRRLRGDPLPAAAKDLHGGGIGPLCPPKPTGSHPPQVLFVARSTATSPHHRMPFRPFNNWKVPPSNIGDESSTASSSSWKILETSDDAELVVDPKTKEPLNGEQYDALERSSYLQQSQRLSNLANNSGVLYSYQRPY